MNREKHGMSFHMVVRSRHLANGFAHLFLLPPAIQEGLRLLIDVGKQ